MPTRAVLFDLDNTLILEDEATRAAVRAAAQVARERAGLDDSRIANAAIELAAQLWKTAPAYADASAFGIWWGEVLWGEFARAGALLRATRAFVRGRRREARPAPLRDRGGTARRGEARRDRGRRLARARRRGRAPRRAACDLDRSRFGCSGGPARGREDPAAQRASRRARRAGAVARFSSSDALTSSGVAPISVARTSIT